MEYLLPGDRIHIPNPMTAGRIIRALRREGYEVRKSGEWVEVITDPSGLTIKRSKE